MKNCENILWLVPRLVTSPLMYFFFSQSLSSATIILPQSRLIKITFCSLSFRSTLISLILASFWFILLYSVVIPPRSGIFRYHSCLFRLIPVSFCFIPESFRLVPAYSGLFRFICVIPPHSGVIPARFGIFRYHSCSFRFIPVSFRCHSASFRHIPVYSGIFRSVPVFSNAPSQPWYITDDRPQHHELYALHFATSVWVLLRSTGLWTLKGCETGPQAYRPYPRRLESLTICRCNYKGSTFSSVI